MTVGKAIKKETWALIVGPLFKMIEAVFDLLIPLFMKAVIDLSTGGDLSNLDVISRSLGNFISLFGTWIPDNPGINYAIIGGTIILLMGIIGFGTTMVCQYIAAVASTKIGTNLRNEIYKKILSLDKKELETFGSGKALTILNSDSYQVQQGVLFFIRLGIRAPFIIIGALVISFVLDWQIGLIFLAIVPVILFIIFYVMRKASKQYLVIQNKLDELSTQTSDNLEGTRVVKAFSKEDEENEKFERSTRTYQEEATRVQRLNAFINPLTFAIVSIATILVVVVGSISMANGVEFMGCTLMPSTIITLVSYLSQIFGTLVVLTNLVTIFTKAIVSGKRVNSLFNVQPAITNCDNPVIKSIEEGDELYRFDDVALAYKDSGNYALEHISFDLMKGQSLGIIGGTGSGKTTLIRLFERMVDASVGSLQYKGEDIKKYDLETLRKEIGFVPQKSVLFKGTIRSNLLMADQNATEEEMITALKSACAYEFVSKYDDFLDHEVEEGGKNFSGGQRQRLCIARAILKNPETLILDDSTSALDLLTDKTVRENISETLPDTTKIVISQRVSTIMNSDLILVLEGGKLIGKGTHESLMQDCDVYRETYESQVQRG